MRALTGRSGSSRQHKQQHRRDLDPVGTFFNASCRSAPPSLAAGQQTAYARDSPARASIPSPFRGTSLSRSITGTVHLRLRKTRELCCACSRAWRRAGRGLSLLTLSLVSALTWAWDANCVTLLWRTATWQIQYLRHVANINNVEAALWNRAEVAVDELPNLTLTVSDQAVHRLRRGCSRGSAQADAKGQGGR